MFCGDFTDRSTQSILVSQQVSDPKGGSCDGETILRRAPKVTATCGANDLQLDDIRSNTQELARCSANLKEPLTERQLKSLKFILVILSSFRVTFSSQIAFSNRGFQSWLVRKSALLSWESSSLDQMANCFMSRQRDKLCPSIH